MKLTPAQAKLFAAHLFAWAVQQARLRSYVAGEWNGPSDSVTQLVRFAMWHSA